jgi:hypothetical protein
LFVLPFFQNYAFYFKFYKTLLNSSSVVSQLRTLIIQSSCNVRYQFALAVEYKSIVDFHSIIIFFMLSEISKVSTIEILHIYQVLLHFSHHTACKTVQSNCKFIVGLASFILFTDSVISSFSQYVASILAAQ